jgi:hypothetical protein
MSTVKIIDINKYINKTGGGDKASIPSVIGLESYLQIDGKGIILKFDNSIIGKKLPDPVDLQVIALNRASKTKVTYNVTAVEMYYVPSDPSANGNTLYLKNDFPITDSGAKIYVKYTDNSANVSDPNLIRGFINSSAPSYEFKDSKATDFNILILNSWNVNPENVLASAKSSTVQIEEEAIPYENIFNSKKVMSKTPGKEWVDETTLIDYANNVGKDDYQKRTGQIFDDTKNVYQKFMETILPRLSTVKDIPEGRTKVSQVDKISSKIGQIRKEDDELSKIIKDVISIYGEDKLQSRKPVINLQFELYKLQLNGLRVLIKKYVDDYDDLQGKIDELLLRTQQKIETMNEIMVMSSETKDTGGVRDPKVLDHLNNFLQVLGNDKMQDQALLFQQSKGVNENISKKYISNSLGGGIQQDEDYEEKYKIYDYIGHKFSEPATDDVLIKAGIINESNILQYGGKEYTARQKEALQYDKYINVIDQMFSILKSEIMVKIMFLSNYKEKWSLGDVKLEDSNLITLIKKIYKNMFVNVSSFLMNEFNYSVDPPEEIPSKMLMYLRELYEGDYDSFDDQLVNYTNVFNNLLSDETKPSDELNMYFIPNLMPMLKKLLLTQKVQQLVLVNNEPSNSNVQIDFTDYPGISQHIVKKGSHRMKLQFVLDLCLAQWKAIKSVYHDKAGGIIQPDFILTINNKYASLLAETKVVYTYIRVRTDKGSVNPRYTLNKTSSEYVSEKQNIMEIVNKEISFEIPEGDEQAIRFIKDADAPTDSLKYEPNNRPGVNPEDKLVVEKVDKYYFGPFDGFFDNTGNREMGDGIFEQVGDKILRGDTFTIFGYGQSGSGKTSSLIYSDFLPLAERDGMVIEMLKAEGIVGNYERIELEMVNIYTKFPTNIDKGGKTRWLVNEMNLNQRRNKIKVDDSSKYQSKYLHGSNPLSKGRTFEYIGDKNYNEEDFVTLTGKDWKNHGFVEVTNNQMGGQADPDDPGLASKNSDWFKDYGYNARPYIDNEGNPFGGTDASRSNPFKDLSNTGAELNGKPRNVGEFSGLLDFVYNKNLGSWVDKGISEDKISDEDYLGMIISKNFELGREIEPTTNNPQSSRSHVVVRLTGYTYKDEDDMLNKDAQNFNVLVCDLAGAENKFRCDGPKNDISKFYNIYVPKPEAAKDPDELVKRAKKNAKPPMYDIYKCNIASMLDSKAKASADSLLTDITNDMSGILDEYKACTTDPDCLESMETTPINVTELPSLEDTFGRTVPLEKYYTDTSQGGYKNKMVAKNSDTAAKQGLYSANCEVPVYQTMKLPKFMHNDPTTLTTESFNAISRVDTPEMVAYYHKALGYPNDTTFHDFDYKGKLWNKKLKEFRDQFKKAKMFNNFFGGLSQIKSDPKFTTDIGKNGGFDLFVAQTLDYAKQIGQFKISDVDIHYKDPVSGRPKPAQYSSDYIEAILTPTDFVHKLGFYNMREKHWKEDAYKMRFPPKNGWIGDTEKIKYKRKSQAVKGKKVVKYEYGNKPEVKDWKWTFKTRSKNGNATNTGYNIYGPHIDDPMNDNEGLINDKFPFELPESFLEEVEKHENVNAITDPSNGKSYVELFTKPGKINKFWANLPAEFKVDQDSKPISMNMLAFNKPWEYLYDKQLAGEFDGMITGNRILSKHNKIKLKKLFRDFPAVFLFLMTSQPSSESNSNTGSGNIFDSDPLGKDATGLLVNNRATKEHEDPVYGISATDKAMGFMDAILWSHKDDYQKQHDEMKLIIRRMCDYIHTLVGIQLYSPNENTPGNPEPFYFYSKPTKDQVIKKFEKQAQDIMAHLIIGRLYYNCNVRVEEGLFINRSLSDMAKSIKDMIIMVNDLSPSMIYWDTLYHPLCYNLNITSDNVYEKPSPKGGVQSVIVDVIKKLAGINDKIFMYDKKQYNDAISAEIKPKYLPSPFHDNKDSTGKSLGYPNAQSNRKFAFIVFTVINTTLYASGGRSVNNPPTPPYVNLSVMKYYYSSGLKDKLADEVKRIIIEQRNNYHYAQLEDIKEKYLKLEEINSNTVNIYYNIIMKIFDANNSSTLLGTLETTEMLQKLNMKFMCYAAPPKMELIEAFREDIVMTASNDEAEFPAVRSKYSSINIKDKNNNSKSYNVDYVI